MYNENIKQNFIEHYITTIQEHYFQLAVESCRQRFMALFEKVESFELMYNKDCSEFNRVQIEAMFNAFGLHSVATLRGYQSMLIKYTEYVTNAPNYYVTFGYDDLVALVVEEEGNTNVQSRI